MHTGRHQMLHNPSRLSLQLHNIVTGAILMFFLSIVGAEARKPIRLFFEKQLADSSLETREHTVRQGEWLYKILKNSGFSEDRISSILPLLRRLNPHIKDLDRLAPGQHLVIPFSGRDAASVRKPHAQAGNVQKPSNEGTLGVREYVVRPGDTLLDILQRTSGLSAGAAYRRLLPRFLEINPDLKNVDRIYPGQNLLLPASDTPGLPSSSTAAAPATPAQKTHTSGPKNKRIQLSSFQQKRFSRLMLEKAGFTFTPGRTILFPDPGGGWVSIDLDATPVCKAPWGDTILMEPKESSSSSGGGKETMKRLRLADWTPKTVIKALAEAFPEHVALHQDGLISRKRGQADITVKGPHLFSLISGTAPRSFCFAPALPADGGLSSLVTSYLAEGGITVTEIRLTPSGGAALPALPPLSQNALYLPEIQAARAASELAAFLAPSEFAASLQALAGKKAYQLHALTGAGLVEARSLDLNWAANGVSVSISIPALILEQSDTRIALLDQSMADRYLMSLVALKGYICFKLLTH